MCISNSFASSSWTSLGIGLQILYHIHQNHGKMACCRIIQKQLRYNYVCSNRSQLITLSYKYVSVARMMILASPCWKRDYGALCSYQLLRMCKAGKLLCRMCVWCCLLKSHLCLNPLRENSQFLGMMLSDNSKWCTSAVYCNFGRDEKSPTNQFYCSYIIVLV